MTGRQATSVTTLISLEAAAKGYDLLIRSSGPIRSKNRPEGLITRANAKAYYAVRAALSSLSCNYTDR